MKWGKARKKPLIVAYREVEGDEEKIITREGTLIAKKGHDFIIRGFEGELYPIDKQIFYKTYDIIELRTEKYP